MPLSFRKDEERARSVRPLRLRPKCRCGCGERVGPYAKEGWIKGHQNRGRSSTRSPERIEANRQAQLQPCYDNTSGYRRGLRPKGVSGAEAGGAGATGG